MSIRLLARKASSKESAMKRGTLPAFIERVFTKVATDMRLPADDSNSVRRAA